MRHVEGSKGDPYDIPSVAHAQHLSPTDPSFKQLQTPIFTGFLWIQKGIVLASQVDPWDT